MEYLKQSNFACQLVLSEVFCPTGGGLRPSFSSLSSTEVSTYRYRWCFTPQLAKMVELVSNTDTGKSIPHVTILSANVKIHCKILNDVRYIIHFTTPEASTYIYIPVDVFVFQSKGSIFSLWSAFVHFTRLDSGNDVVCYNIIMILWQHCLKTSNTISQVHKANKLVSNVAPKAQL